MQNIGVKVTGLQCPIIREGDPLIKIVADTVLGSGLEINDRDIVGITESVVARAYGLYVTVDDIARDIKEKFGENAVLALINPIYSRNRFSMILKGIARAAKKIIFVMPIYDEVGNPRGVNPFTGVNIEEYYTEICKQENCEVEILHELRTIWNDNPNLIYPGIDYVKDHIDCYIDCSLHPYIADGKSWSSLGLHSWYCFHPLCTLVDLCSKQNPDYGLLGSNKATEEKLKLFPTKQVGAAFVRMVQQVIFDRTGKWVEVMIYGDGCFKSPSHKGVSIWEFADPVVSPAYTDGLVGTPNEIKIKAFADDEFAKLSGDELTEAVKAKIRTKESNLVGNMASQGTTPRCYVDLLGSLMDLTSGSGDKGTPIVVVQNYFNNYSTC